MMAFGTSVGNPDKWRKHCIPGVQHNVDEPHRWLSFASENHVPGVYQKILESVRAMPDVDVLVFLHDDLQIQDPKFAQKIRAAVGAGFDVVGLVGTTKLASLHWWEHGPDSWRGYAVDGRDGRTVVDGGFAEGDPCPVESVDGMLFALSRWAIDHLSFKPESYPGLHGYVEEACTQARRHGGRVGVTRIDAFHHTQGGFAGGQEAFERANEVWKRRWGFA